MACHFFVSCVGLIFAASVGSAWRANFVRLLWSNLLLCRNKMAKEAAKPSSGGGGKQKKKKWSKGKVKDKANNAVLLDKETLGKILKEVPQYKVITPSVLVDRLKINGSLARLSLRELYKQGKIKLVASHHAQLIYTRTTAAAEEAKEAEEKPKEEKVEKGKKEPKAKGKKAEEPKEGDDS